MLCIHMCMYCIYTRACTVCAHMYVLYIHMCMYCIYRCACPVCAHMYVLYIHMCMYCIYTHACIVYTHVHVLYIHACMYCIYTCACTVYTHVHVLRTYRFIPVSRWQQKKNWSWPISNSQTLRAFLISLSSRSVSIYFSCLSYLEYSKSICYNYENSPIYYPAYLFRFLCVCGGGEEMLPFCR